MALTGLLLPPLLGATFAGPARLAGTWAHLLGQNYAKNAVETAAWAIASARLGVPLSRLWGGTRDAVPVGESFPICDTVDALHEEVAARVAEGFGRIKLKIAPGWDVGQPGPCARPSPTCRCRSTPTAATPPVTRSSPTWTSSACS